MHDARPAQGHHQAVRPLARDENGRRGVVVGCSRWGRVPLRFRYDLAVRRRVPRGFHGAFARARARSALPRFVPLAGPGRPAPVRGPKQEDVAAVRVTRLGPGAGAVLHAAGRARLPPVALVVRGAGPLARGAALRRYLAPVVNAQPGRTPRSWPGRTRDRRSLSRTRTRSFPARRGCTGRRRRSRRCSCRHSCRAYGYRTGPGPACRPHRRRRRGRRGGRPDRPQIRVGRPCSKRSRGCSASRRASWRRCSGTRGLCRGHRHSSGLPARSGYPGRGRIPPPGPRSPSFEAAEHRAERAAYRSTKQRAARVTVGERFRQPVEPVLVRGACSLSRSRPGRAAAPCPIDPMPKTRSPGSPQRTKPPGTRQRVPGGDPCPAHEKTRPTGSRGVARAQDAPGRAARVAVRGIRSGGRFMAECRGHEGRVRKGQREGTVGPMGGSYWPGAGRCREGARRKTDRGRSVTDRRCRAGTGAGTVVRPPPHALGTRRAKRTGRTIGVGWATVLQPAVRRPCPCPFGRLPAPAPCQYH